MHRARGGTPSALKDAAAIFTANMQAFGGALLADEVIKGSMLSYTFEHLEIACYRSLIGAAEELGDRETARVYTDILRQEEAMAGLLEQRLPELSREFVRRQRAGQPAKRQRKLPGFTMIAAPALRPKSFPPS